MPRSSVFRLRHMELAALLSALIIGCGSVSDGFKGERGQVSGTIEFEGVPIPEGSVVTFQSKDGPSYIAFGIVDADGEYDLVYNGKRELPAGTYMVQISPPSSSASPSVAGTVDPLKIDHKKLREDADAMSSPFPKKYSSYTTSKLTFEVDAGLNTADFDLTK